MAKQVEHDIKFIRNISSDRILIRFDDDTFERGIDATGTSDANIIFPTHLGQNQLYIFERNTPVEFLIKSPDNKEFGILFDEANFNFHKGEELIITPVFPPVEPEPEPEYPKTITRGEYSFTAENSEEEKQINEFLGIEPAGDDMDTWLEKKDKPGLDEWYEYWVTIFTNLGRTDLTPFIAGKWKDYAIKLEEEEPPKVPWWEKAIDFIKEVTIEKFTLSPKLTISPYLTLIQNAIIKKADREEFDLPDWIWDTGLAVFFLDLEDFTDETIVTGTVPITPAGSILTLLKSTSFNKALDIMKANPLKYASDFAKLSPKTAAQILKGMRKDQLAGLATSVFKTSWDEALIKTAPLWKRTMFATAKHKWKGFFGLISLAGLIMGTDLWGNWAIVDNLQFMSGREADDIKAAFLDGRMTREEALAELNQMLAIVEAGETKVKTSSGWNLFQIIFAPLWDDLAALTVEKIKTRIEEIEEITPPEPKGRLIIRPTPEDAKVSVEGQIPSTGTYSKELPIGIYTYTVSKFGFISKSDSVTLTEGDTKEINVVLEEEVAPPVPPEEMEGTLTISITPEDALIEVSGQPEITSPGTFTLLQGFYTLKASKEGFETQITTIYIKAEEETRISIILKEIIIPPEISIIRVESNPIAAKIFIDGVNTFDITNTSLQVEPGAHTLTLKKREFIDAVEEFEIKEGESLLFNLTLEAIPVPPPPAKATITITSNPTNADIYINGEYTFTKTPYTVILDAGSYIIRVQKEKYFPVEITAEISEGEVEDIPFTLQEIPPEEKPVEPYIPYQPVYAKGYETLYPPVQAPVFYEKPPAPVEKELLINIETTDVKPWEGRIYSIALLDLTTPGVEPIVLINDNEEELIRDFLGIFNELNPKKLLGFKLTFDHRYIFSKMMLYRLPNKSFKNIEMLDVKQILDQVQEKFVYFPSKIGTLNDWGKHLLGKGKLGSQELMLRKYLAGDFEYVKAFQLRQMEITKGLYDLTRFVGLESLPAPISSTTSPTPALPPTLSPESPAQTGEKKCPNCLAEQPISSKECDICHQQI